MHKYVSIGAIAVLLGMAACSTTTDNGLRIGVGTGHSDGYRATPPTPATPLTPSSTGTPAAYGREAAQLANHANADLIVVGETGLLNKLSPAEREQFYQAYLKAARRQGGAGADIGGLSRIETFKVPGVFSQDLPVAVRTADIGRLKFASVAGSLVTGATGDLVAARNNADGLLVIERVLCREGAPDYRQCAAAFAKGRFDPRTGDELDGDLQPKRDGARIDPATYRSLQAAR